MSPASASLPVAVKVKGVSLELCLRCLHRLSGLRYQSRLSFAASDTEKVSQHLIIAAVMKTQDALPYEAVRSTGTTAVRHQRHTAPGFPSGESASLRAAITRGPIKRVVSPVLVA